MTGQDFQSWVEERSEAQREETRLRERMASLLGTFKSGTEELLMSLDDMSQGLLILFEGEHDVKVYCGRPREEYEVLAEENEIGSDTRGTVWVVRCKDDPKLRVYCDVEVAASPA